LFNTITHVHFLGETALKNVTNLEDGKQLPAIIDVFWALVIKQEPVG